MLLAMVPLIRARHVVGVVRPVALVTLLIAVVAAAGTLPFIATIACVRNATTRAAHAHAHGLCAAAAVHCGAANGCDTTPAGEAGQSRCLALCFALCLGHEHWCRCRAGIVRAVVSATATCPTATSDSGSKLRTSGACRRRNGWSACYRIGRFGSSSCGAGLLFAGRRCSSLLSALFRPRLRPRLCPRGNALHDGRFIFLSLCQLPCFRHNKLGLRDLSTLGVSIRVTVRCRALAFCVLRRTIGCARCCSRCLRHC